MGGEVPELRRLSRRLSFDGGGVPEEALHLVLGYVDDPRDREAASLVCRHWHRIDALTCKHVTVGFCYAAEPVRQHLVVVVFVLLLPCRQRAEPADLHVLADEPPGLVPVQPPQGTQGAGRPRPQAADLPAGRLLAGPRLAVASAPPRRPPPRRPVAAAQRASSTSARPRGIALRRYPSARGVAL